MKTNTTFEKLFFALALTVTITSCGSSSDKTEANNKDSVVTTTTTTATVESAPAQPTDNKLSFSEFDWTPIPQSSAQIGSFPYITAPEGFYIGDKDSYDESKTGYSEMKDFNKLIMFNGTSFYNAEGKVAELKFRMKEKDADWNQYKFDMSIDKYLSSIGAKLIGKLKVNEPEKEFLNKDDDMVIYHHIVGDPYNDPVRCYALNHPKGKIMFQVFSNSASGEIGVVELASFKQTVKAPKAAAQ